MTVLGNPKNGDGCHHDLKVAVYKNKAVTWRFWTNEVKPKLVKKLFTVYAKLCEDSNEESEEKSNEIEENEPPLSEDEEDDEEDDEYPGHRFIQVRVFWSIQK